MSDHVLLGLDISTTGAKALLIKPNGDVIGSASVAQTVSNPKPLWSEQNPTDWWEGMAQAIKQALTDNNISAEQVAAIGMTGQMHGLVLLDAQGEVLRPAILWNDGRTSKQCDEIRARVGKARLIQITGNDALEGFTAPKVLWVSQEEPDVYAKAAHILLPKDYIRYRLTGTMAVDRAGGAGTILFDLKERTWSREIAEALDIPMAWLPPTFEGTEITGQVSAEAAALTGLKAGTPVVGGGGDQAAQATGVGAVEQGVIALTVGTSGVVFAPLDEPAIQPEGRLHAFCHAAPGKWHFMGVMLSAAGSFQWFKDTLASGTSFDALVTEAEQVPIGSQGLYFAPYLTGERTPYPDPLARGAWVGLTVRHKRGDMVRSVLEGVAYGLKDSFTLIQAAGGIQINEVRVSGGAAQSATWRQIMADVLGSELHSVNTTEGAAFGAALCAGVGVGLYDDIVSACRSAIQITDTTTPNPENAARYAELYPGYQRLYGDLKPTFDAVAEM